MKTSQNTGVSKTVKNQRKNQQQTNNPTQNQQKTTKNNPKNTKPGSVALISQPTPPNKTTTKTQSKQNQNKKDIFEAKIGNIYAKIYERYIWREKYLYK